MQRGVSWASFLLICLSCGSEPSTAPSVVRFSADRNRVALGERVELSWEVAGAATVSIDGPVGALLVADTHLTASVTSGPIDGASTFTLTTKNAAGESATARVEITIDTTTPRIARFDAIPASVPAGELSTLTWSVTGSDFASIDIVGPGEQMLHHSTEANGTFAVHPGATSVYRLVARVGPETLMAMTTVTVLSSQPRITSLTASPSTPVRGMNGTIAWATSGADQVQLSRDGRVIRPFTANGAAMGFTGVVFDTPPRSAGRRRAPTPSRSSPTGRRWPRFPGPRRGCCRPASRSRRPTSSSRPASRGRLARPGASISATRSSFT